MYTIGLLVGPEQGIWDWYFDDLNGAPLGIRGAGQPVVGVQGNLMLHNSKASSACTAADQAYRSDTSCLAGSHQQLDVQSRISICC